MTVTFTLELLPLPPRGPLVPGRPRRPRGPGFPGWPRGPVALGWPWGPVSPGWPRGPGGPWRPVKNSNNVDSGKHVATRFTLNESVHVGKTTRPNNWVPWQLISLAFLWKYGSKGRNWYKRAS